MADNPYAPSNLGGAPPAPGYAPSSLPGVTPSTGPALAGGTGYVAPAAKPTGAYSPSDIHSALLGAGATPGEATTLTAVSGAESNFGKSPISPPNKNGSRDYGVFQINNAAHPQMGGAAVAAMPLNQQAALALQIARSREGFGAWTTYTSGAYKAHLGQVGSTTPTGSIPASVPADAQPATPASVGAALAALNGPTSDPQLKSTMQSVQDMISQDSSKAPTPENNLQGQMAAGANAHNEQVAALAPQLMLQARQMSGLQGARGVPGMASTMSYQGGQMIPMPVASSTPGAPPGTTLNSTGGLYG